MFVSACRRQAMAASLMDEGQFKTLSKYAAQHFKNLSLLVKIVLPSVLSEMNATLLLPFMIVLPFISKPCLTCT